MRAKIYITTCSINIAIALIVMKSSRNLSWRWDYGAPRMSGSDTTERPKQFLIPRDSLKKSQTLHYLAKIQELVRK